MLIEQDLVTTGTKASLHDNCGRMLAAAAAGYRSLSLVESVFLPSAGELAPAGHRARFAEAHLVARVGFAGVQGGIV